MKGNFYCSFVSCAPCSHFRKNYRKVLNSIVKIQKNYRAHLYRRRFLRQRSATLVLQKHRRGQVARGVCRKLREEKKKREEEERRTKEDEKTDGDQEKKNEDGTKATAEVKFTSLIKKDINKKIGFSSLTV